MKLDLKTATPEQINAAVAEQVAGWKYFHPSDKMGELWENDHGQLELDGPDFATSADAVLPLLEKCLVRGGAHMIPLKTNFGGTRWKVSVWRNLWWSGESSTFSLAACIALLRAHGVEVKE